MWAEYDLLRDAYWIYHKRHIYLVDARVPLNVACSHVEMDVAQERMQERALEEEDTG